MAKHAVAWRCCIILIICDTAQSIDIFSELYVGCYPKTSSTSTSISEKNSIKYCGAYCSSEGYTYYGMHGTSCYCGNAYDDSAVNDIGCWDNYRVKCPGNHSEVCGGSKRYGRIRTLTSLFRVCPTGWYGSSCADECPESCKEKGCHFDGNCLDECPAGRQGINCSQACPEGKFSAKCKRSCSGCLNNRCHPVNGYCKEGCNRGGKGPFCLTSTNAGTNNPTGPCPFCGHCKDSICTGGTGTAYNACPDAWQGDLCQNCDDGLWGSRCEYTCANCASDKCSQTDGVCLASGCQDGYFSPTCYSLCPLNCKFRRCSKDSGICTNGCVIGFYGDLCDFTCPENCANGLCSPESGICSDGCQPGYQGTACTTQVCPPRTFSSFCLDCHCEGAVNCDVVSGVCPGTCEDGWSGDNCQMMVVDEQGGGITITVLAVIVSLLVFGMIASLMTYFIYNRTCSTPPVRHPQDDERHVGNLGNRRSQPQQTGTVSPPAPPSEIPLLHGSRDQAGRARETTANATNAGARRPPSGNTLNVGKIRSAPNVLERRPSTGNTPGVLARMA